jgi:hypothetical protein
MPFPGGRHLATPMTVWPSYRDDYTTLYLRRLKSPGRRKRKYLRTNCPSRAARDRRTQGSLFCSRFPALPQPERLDTGPYSSDTRKAVIAALSYSNCTLGVGKLEPAALFRFYPMPRKKPKMIAAAHRVADARRIVADQRALIARLKAYGHPVVDAEAALQMYVGALALLEDHERRMKAENRAKQGETKKPRSP